MLEMGNELHHVGAILPCGVICALQQLDFVCSRIPAAAASAQDSVSKARTLADPPVMICALLYFERAIASGLLI